MLRNFNALNQSVQYIKGVGPKRIKILQKLKLYSVADLLYYIPRRYEDRSNFKPISKVTLGNLETIKGRVLTFGNRRTKKGLTIFHLAVGDESGVIYGTWFNQPYLKDRFKVGQQVILYGKVEYYKHIQINSPEYEIIADDEENDETIHTGRIVPIYPLTSEISQRYLRTIAKRCLDDYLALVEEFLPAAIIKTNDLMSLKEAISNIHFPVSMQVLEKARKRLIFDEFFFLEMAIALKRREIMSNKKGIAYKIKGVLTQKLKNSLPFELTRSQKNVIDEIEQDMGSARPMNRLLQGDVGSGKTIVGIWAMAIVVQNGFQAVLMAPTEILVQQHYQTIKSHLEPLGVRVLLLSGGLKKNEKLKINNLIKEQKADVIVGTHSLIEEGVEFGKLGLVIVDEQHKFGVMQRMKLQEKGIMPDVLVMSATPIPRTLAITLYGDMDVSTIKELPSGRTPVKTFWIDEKKRADLYGFLRKKMKEKNQVYVVYPVIEESKIKDLKAATMMFEHFRDKVFPEFEVGLIHGRIKDEEKREIMGRFKNGQISLLVATTVIEVGIDVAAASIMLIEHAERFGLSQLHQLRGRVGRGKEQSYCILISDEKTEEAIKRLSAMTKTTDGFKIAEYDLLIRGPGEFFGTRQHGLPEIRIGNIIFDRDLLILARKEAFAYLEAESLFSGKEGRVLKSLLFEKFPNNDDLILAR